MKFDAKSKNISSLDGEDMMTDERNGTTNSRTIGSNPFLQVLNQFILFLKHFTQILNLLL